MTHDNFYRALEDRFRASQEVISQRLTVYLPFLQALTRLHPEPTGFDIGCGRGEWLELLTRSGWQAWGVDLDDSMLAACHERGLDVAHQDALEALQQQPDHSLELVSAFHVVEHLPFDYLQRLLHEAFRVLKPGGLLILETPNSENLMVGTSNFYIDPTHQRPVPAVFLEFLCQYCGFSRSKVLRLQEDPALHAPEAVTGVWQVLYGVSPDYAVVAQKPAPDLPDPFKAVFDKTYGFDLETLAVRYDRHIQHLEGRVREVTRLYQEQAAVLDQLTHRALQELDAVYTSRSWKITRPLRVATKWAHRHNRAAIKRALITELRRPVKGTLDWLCTRFNLNDPLHSAFKYLPSLDQKMRQCLARFDALIVPQVLDFSACAQEYPFQIQQLTRRLQQELIAQERLTLKAPREGLPRLAYVSPLPPERTGIADYSAELLPALAEHYQIEVVVAQPEIEGDWIHAHCPIRDAAWLISHADDYDVVLYHIGNSHFHGWMLDLLKQVPGIVVLHDFYLSGLIWALEETPAHHGIKWQALYAEQGYSGMQELATAQNESTVAFHYPFNLQVLEWAQGIIVHSEASKRLARHWYGDAVAQSWMHVPHLRQPLTPEPRAQARAALGLPEEAFIVCSFGLLGLTKLNDRLLTAWLTSVLAQNSNSYLVFVGALSEDDYGQALCQQIADSGLSARIRITGWADMACFRHYLSAADVAVQLRTLSRGESSGTVLDCMNYGLPTIVNAHGSMADLPEEAVLRLPDAFTDTELVAALEQLWHAPEQRQQLGRRARQLLEEQHAPAQCALGYQQAIEHILARVTAETRALREPLKALDNPLQVIESGQATLMALAEHLAHSQPSVWRAPQLLIDVTATCQHDRHTGIERVARALTLALLADPPAGMRVEPVYLTEIGDRWHYRYAQAWTAKLLGIPPQIEDTGINFAPGDQLIALDISGESFIKASQAGLYTDFQSHGVSCHVLIHDLLPVTHSDYFPPRAAVLFERWLQQAVQLDAAICVSQTVARHLLHWMDRQPERPNHLRVDYSHHGADLSQSAPSKGLPEEAPHLLATLARMPSILMVGTLEPRKGYAQALGAFSVLWEQGVDVCLVIVGREGWRELPDDQRRDIPQLMTMLRHHPELGRHLFWLDGISDEYLEQLYGAAQGLLAASWDEGFGLPLIEAAQKGLPILARDIPVFREVGGEHLCYFTASIPEELAQAIRDWMGQGFQPTSKGMPWLHWQESARRLKHLLARP